VTFAVAVATALLAARQARANDPFHHTIPREVDAIDLNTGQPYYAPPIPYGHYAKGSLLGRFCGCLASPFHMLAGLGHGLGCKQCGACGGKGCGLCGGKGMICNGDGADMGHGHGLGHGHGGLGDSGCGGKGCGLGLGFGHGKRFNGCGLCGGKGCGICTSTVMPSAQAAPAVVTIASPQAVEMPACGTKGCGLGGKHKHLGGGLGGCLHGAGGLCDNCGGGLGRGCFHGPGAKCGNCLGGLGHGKGNGCPFCGGAGCNKCMGGNGLGLLGHLRGSINGLLHPHAGKVEYFVGPGGPVPITPGYVPYVNPVRSPRDYFAFPPMTQ
jgi:hypothetical protein